MVNKKTTKYHLHTKLIHEREPGFRLQVLVRLEGLPDPLVEPPFLWGGASHCAESAQSPSFAPPFSSSSSPSLPDMGGRGGEGRWELLSNHSVWKTAWFWLNMFGNRWVISHCKANCIRARCFIWFRHRSYSSTIMMRILHSIIK